MLKTMISSRGLVPLSLAFAAGAGLLVSAPVQAGPFDFIKAEVSKAAKKQARKTIEKAFGVDAQVHATGQDRDPRANAQGINIATGDITGDGTADIIPAAGPGNAPQDKPLRQEGGTTVATADLVLAPGNDEDTQPTRLEQNGTTVATANELQAPGGESEIGLLLPAVQRVRD